MIARDYKIIGLVFLIYSLIFSVSEAKGNTVVIDPDAEIGKVNPYVFGNNVLAHESKYFPHNQFSDYGCGLWDPKLKRPVKNVVNLAREAKVTVLRYPGGCGAHLYDWKKTIGVRKDKFLFGIDEFLEVIAQIKAEPVFTISFFTGDHNDAADFVEYLNSPDDGSNQGGGEDWAKARAQNGHPAAYKIKYFEIGNEAWHGNHKDIWQITSQEYAARYLLYYDAMKSVDPSIYIGAIFEKPKWNQAVMEIIKDKLDFAILHMYPGAYMKNVDLAAMEAKDIFRTIITNPEEVRVRQIQETLKLLKEKSGRNIPLAITEYNCGFRHEKPVPYRHCLGTALINAEMLKILMQPSNNILMANYWNFANEYWGMITNHFSGKGNSLYNSYIKRPNYYVFQMYSQHFGEILVAAKVKAATYQVNQKIFDYLSVNASKSREGNILYLMVINRNLEEEIFAAVEFENFVPSSTIEAFVLSGASVDATNEIKHDSVKITQTKAVKKGSSFVFSFKPHSLTALEIKRRN